MHKFSKKFTQNMIFVVCCIMSPSRKPPDFVVLVNSLYIRIGLRDFYFF